MAKIKRPEWRRQGQSESQKAAWRKSLDQVQERLRRASAIAGHYEEVRVPLQRYVGRYPNILPAYLLLAAVDSELGQEAEAQTETAEVLRLNPKFSLEVHKQRIPIKDPAVLERHIAALRKAGLK
jgi:hypothetical protein